MSEVRVQGLNYYPIKSCGGIEADTITFTELGIEHDREFMLVGPKGQFISQRTHPKLATVETRIEDGVLFTRAAGMSELATPLSPDPDAEVIPIDLFKKPGSGTNVGLDAQAYFSEYLGKDARLIQLQDPRTIKPECHVDGAATTTGFADGFPILLASSSSLEELNSHLERPIKMSNFRPNITVEGGEPYDEDYWREVKIGKLNAFAVRACARCPMPNIDQQVGILTRQRPVTEALRQTRYGIDPVNDSTGEFFGQNLAHVFEPGTTVSVGDQVTIVERAQDRNVYLTNE
jgi:uncharacterized protein YcbX